jgi:hypothetical protein
MKNCLFFILLCFSVISFGGTSNVYNIEGLITKIIDNKVTIVYQGKDVVVEKIYIPKEKLKVGNFVSITIKK